MRGVSYLTSTSLALIAFGIFRHQSVHFIFFILSSLGAALSSGYLNRQRRGLGFHFSFSGPLRGAGRPAGRPNPADLPDAVVRRLNTAINKVLAAPATAERLAALGAEPLVGPPQDITTLISNDRQR